MVNQIHDLRKSLTADSVILYRRIWLFWTMTMKAKTYLTIFGSFFAVIAGTTILQAAVHPSQVAQATKLDMSNYQFDLTCDNAGGKPSHMAFDTYRGLMSDGDHTTRLYVTDTSLTFFEDEYQFQINRSSGVIHTVGETKPDDICRTAPFTGIAQNRF